VPTARSCSSARAKQSADEGVSLQMDREAELEIIRRAYAKQVLASVGVDDARLEEAYAAVRRERYLAQGPWPILRSRGYVATPDDDPVYLYTDVLVGIIPERGLNNGMPSYHAPLISSASVRAGDHVVHIGAGLGYYTAILSHLAGNSGKVTAIEFDPSLARAAESNFAAVNNIAVIQGDGGALSFEAADVIYVNAGATRPADIWLDRLKDGGRLILPLTARKTMPSTHGGSLTRHGAVFRIERQGSDFHARWISAVGVYPCEGGRDEHSEAALDAALRAGGWQNVTRLYRSDDVPAESCWLRGSGWALAYA
jgi:protein-L-isoaspartate(D-aspartate) O-methyltransferase